MTVFALYEGNLLDGGEVLDMYSEVETAISDALAKVDFLQKQWDAMYEGRPQMGRRWLNAECLDDATVKRWSNGRDEIKIIRYETK